MIFTVNLRSAADKSRQESILMLIAKPEDWQQRLMAHLIYALLPFNHWLAAGVFDCDSGLPGQGRKVIMTRPGRRSLPSLLYCVISSLALISAASMRAFDIHHVA